VLVTALEMDIQLHPGPFAGDLDPFFFPDAWRGHELASNDPCRLENDKSPF
jgi:hypothetical protein